MLKIYVFMGGDAGEEFVDDEPDNREDEAYERMKQDKIDRED